MNPEKQSRRFSETFTGNPIQNRENQMELVSSRSTDELEHPTLTEAEIAAKETVEIAAIKQKIQNPTVEMHSPLELSPEQESYKTAYLELKKVENEIGKLENAYMLDDIRYAETLPQEDKDLLKNRQQAIREKISELKEKQLALSLKVHQLETECQNKNLSTEDALAHKTKQEKQDEHRYKIQQLEHRILTQQEHLDAVRSQRALPKEERKLFTHLQNDDELENEELLFEKLIAKSKQALKDVQESASPLLKRKRLEKEMHLASQTLDKLNIKIRKDNTLSFRAKRKIRNNPEARIAWATYQELEDKIAALPTTFEDSSAPKRYNEDLGDRREFHGDEEITNILDDYFKQEKDPDAVPPTIPNLETQLSQLETKRDSLYDQLGNYGVKLKANNTLSYWNRGKVRRNPVLQELWHSYQALDEKITKLRSEEFTNIPETIEAPAVQNSDLPETIEALPVPNANIPETIEVPAVQDSKEYIPSTSNTITGKPEFRYPEVSNPENKLLQTRRELAATFPKELQQVVEAAEQLRRSYVTSTDTRNAEQELTKLAEVGVQQIRDILKKAKGTQKEKIAASYLNGIKSLLLAYKPGKKPRREGTTDPHIAAEIRNGIIDRLNDPKNLLVDVGNFESMMATLKANSPEQNSEPVHQDVLPESAIPTQDVPLPKLELVSSQDTDQQQTFSDIQVARRIAELEESIRHQQKVIERSKNNTDIDSYLERGVITEEKHQEMKANRTQSRKEAELVLDLHIEELARLEKRNSKLREVTPLTQESVDETIVPDNEISEHYIKKETQTSLFQKTRMAYIKMRVAENRQYLITQRQAELQSKSKKLEHRIQNVESQIKNLQPSKFKSFFMSAEKKRALAESSAKLDALHKQLLWNKNEIDMQLRTDEEFTIELPQVELDLQLHKADLAHYEEVGVVDDIIEERDRLDENRREYGYDPGDESEDIPFLDEMIEYMDEIASEYEEAA